MSIDWRDQRRRDRIVVQRVSAADLGTPLGELEGVVLAGSTVEGSYYSDTRTSAKLNVWGGAWSPGEYVRIIHQVPDEGWARELGTYIVTDREGERERGAWSTPLTLQSMLYGLSLDALPRPWTVAANAMASKAMAQIMDQSVHAWSDLGGDYRFKSARVLDAGTTRLAAMYELAKLAGSRLDVDGHGTITAERYTAPREKAAVWRFSLEEARGIVEGPVSFSSDLLEIPDTVAVAHRFNAAGRDQAVYGSATVGATSPLAAQARGYRIVDFRDVSDMTPETAARAQQLAGQYLAAGTAERIEWELRCAYVPIWEGDAVELEVPDGPYPGIRHALVKGIAIDLATLAMRLTLKETTGEDVE